MNKAKITGSMLMKKIISYILICICCFGLCGCTDYPKMSDSDMDLVAEYAAGILLKHSATAENRLMNVEEALVALEAEKQQDEVEVEPEEPMEEPEKEPEELKEPEIPIIDNTENITEEYTYPINDVMGIELLSVQFDGYEIKDSYPDGSGAFFALDAGDGNKLLVEKITLTNNTDSSVDINMLDKQASFKVSLDGNGYKFALSTMLLDDLSTYVGTIGAGNSVELVLLSEWSIQEIENISNPTLYIKNGELSGTYTIQ